MTAPAEEAERANGESQRTQAEVCQASLEAARAIIDPLMEELARPQSVLYAVVADRASRLPEDNRLGVAPGLLVDPRRTGVVVERYRLQGGQLPADAADSATITQIPLLWASQTEAMPKLAVPESSGDAIMELADKLQMRGGGPIIFSREEVSQMPVGPNTIVKIAAAARNASRQRTRSALALWEANPEYDQPLIATANPRRKLRQDEQEAVKEFAPEARNELELFIDSAIAEGFIAQPGERYGVRILEDGSSYQWVHHPNGARMLVLAPAVLDREDGSKQTGLYNGYQSLITNGPELLGDSFKLEGSDMVDVTSTHYGPMSAINNLLAVHELRTELGSFRVLGDNQPARTPMAHLVEVGLTLESARRATEEPVLKKGLIELPTPNEQ